MKPHLPYPCLTLITRLDAAEGGPPAAGATENDAPDNSRVPTRTGAPAHVPPGTEIGAVDHAAARLIRQAQAAVQGGARAVQLREKALPAADLYALARQLRRVTRDRALFIVNDRIDVALAVGADGVHLPENGLPVAAARRLVGAEVLLGCSVHSVAAAVRCADAGADYVQVGTLFATDSKPGRAPAGPGLARNAAEAVDIPVIGVGGITARNAAVVMEDGAHGVAVIGALLDAPDTAAAARALVRALAQLPEPRIS